MSFPAPPAPAFAPAHAATTRDHLRYEDCTQDGRLIPLALPPAMGGLWQEVIVASPRRAQRDRVRHHPDPDPADAALARAADPDRSPDRGRARASQLAHDLDERGEVARLFMNVWCEVRGIAGRIGPRQVEGALSPAGHRVRRAHVHPAVRAARSAPGHPARGRGVSGRARGRATPQPPPTTAQRGCRRARRWLDELAAGSGRGRVHARSDRREPARQLAGLHPACSPRPPTAAWPRPGAPLTVRSRAVDIAYRKPCFAGDRVRAHVRLFEHAAGLGAAGLIVGAEGKPRCYVRVLFDPDRGSGHPIGACPIGQTGPGNHLGPARQAVASAVRVVTSGVSPQPALPCTGGFSWHSFAIPSNGNGGPRRSSATVIRSRWPAICSRWDPFYGGRPASAFAPASRSRRPTTRSSSRRTSPASPRRTSTSRPQQRPHRQRQPAGRGAQGGRELRALRAPVRLVLAQLLAARDGRWRAHRGQARRRRPDPDDREEGRGQAAQDRAQEVGARAGVTRRACTRRGTRARASRDPRGGAIFEHVVARDRIVLVLGDDADLVDAVVVVERCTRC